MLSEKRLCKLGMYYCYRTDRPIKLLLCINRVLDHMNLCKFIGATIKNPGNISIISEYCPKGSLNDILQSSETPLNWGFRFSFASDIARGMAYLHSKKLCHGRLSSNNCVVDDRWVVKIAGTYVVLLPYAIVYSLLK